MKTDYNIRTHRSLVKRYIDEGKQVQAYYDLKQYEDIHQIPHGIRATGNIEPVNEEEE